MSIDNFGSRYRLSLAEQRVLALLVDGGTNITIASDLQICKHTVTKHMTQILDKTGQDDRLNVVILYYRQAIEELLSKVNPLKVIEDGL